MIPQSLTDDEQNSDKNENKGKEQSAQYMKH